MAIALCGMMGAQLAAATTAAPPPAQIRHGRETADFPAVGAVNTGSQFCTAVLIGCDTALTAAHCVCPAQSTTYAGCVQLGVADPTRTKLFFQHVGFVGVRSIAVDPEYVQQAAGDLAILKLSSPVTGIAPLPINIAFRPPAGTNETVVGFGRDEGKSMTSGVGVKRTASVTLTDCPPGIPGQRFDCYVAQSDAQPSSCPGDSGGPLLADLGSGVVVTGVTSGARGGKGVFNCRPPFAVLNTDTFVHRGFIEEHLAPDSSDGPCGDLPAVGDDGVEAATFRGPINGSHKQVRGSIDVPEGTLLLRVTMNGSLGTDKGANNFDLFIRAGAAPSASDFTCADTQPASYGACEITAPAAGKWHVLAQQVTGSGTVQLTTTLFADRAPSPTPTATDMPTRGPTATPRPPVECVGDCDDDGQIAIAEIVRGVGLALGNAVTPCADFDPEGDGVRIADLVRAVSGALDGCVAR